MFDPKIIKKSESSGPCNNTVKELIYLMGTRSLSWADAKALGYDSRSYYRALKQVEAIETELWGRGVMQKLLEQEAKNDKV